RLEHREEIPVIEDDLSEVLDIGPSVDIPLLARLREDGPGTAEEVHGVVDRVAAHVGQLAAAGSRWRGESLRPWPLQVEGRVEVHAEEMMIAQGFRVGPRTDFFPEPGECRLGADHGNVVNERDVVPSDGRRDPARGVEAVTRGLVEEDRLAGG